MELVADLAIKRVDHRAAEIHELEVRIDRQVGYTTIEDLRPGDQDGFLKAIHRVHRQELCACGYTDQYRARR